LRGVVKRSSSAGATNYESRPTADCATRLQAVSVGLLHPVPQSGTDQLVHFEEEKMGIRAKKAKKAAPKRRPRKKAGAKKKAAKKK
jgi:hypothetical protein